jgi:PRTRC genetic system protein B
MSMSDSNFFSLASESRDVANFAVVFYRDRSVATLHPVFEQSNGASIGPGRFLRQDDLSALSRVFGEASARQPSILPERVLGCGSDFITWYRPAERTTMSFLVHGKPSQLSVIWPSLIFHARNQTLYAAAYVNDGRPSASTGVYAVPLMNFYDDGSMCRGNARYPASYAPESIPEWEFAVYGTTFTHINDSCKLRGRPDTDEAHLAFWSHPARARFPLQAKHLVPLSWAPTCGDWLSAIENGEASR